MSTGPGRFVGADTDDDAELKDTHAASAPKTARMATMRFTAAQAIGHP